MKKFFSGFLVLCLSLALLSACDRGGQPDKTVTAGGLTFAKSYSEVYSALTDAQKAIAERNTLLKAILRRIEYEKGPDGKIVIDLYPRLPKM